MNGNDIRMVQPRQHASFALKPAQSDSVSEQGTCHDLECYGATQVQVCCLKDHAHAAAANPAVQPVSSRNDPLDGQRQFQFARVGRASLSKTVEARTALGTFLK